MKCVLYHIWERERKKVELEGQYRNEVIVDCKNERRLMRIEGNELADKNAKQGQETLGVIKSTKSPREN